MEPYWSGGGIELYHGDCREHTEWLAADVLVTDPPYGIGWKGAFKWGQNPETVEYPDGHPGIAGDSDTTIRDSALDAWGTRPALVFGSLKAAYPTAWKRMLVFEKPTVACGFLGNHLPWLVNWEPIFVLGEWPRTSPKLSAVIPTSAPSAGGWSGYITRGRHPHAKPIDVMERLIAECPSGVIADPFAGTGATLVAARYQNRCAIGVEIEERYCEIAARRLNQGVLNFEETVS